MAIVAKLLVTFNVRTTKEAADKMRESENRRANMAEWNKPKEANVIRSILTYLSNLDNCFAWKNHGGRFANTGMPDIMAMYYRHDDSKLIFFAFEVKRPGTARKRLPEGVQGKELWVKQGATEIQAQVLQDIERVGGESHVVEGVKQVREIVQRITGEGGQ